MVFPLSWSQAVLGGTLEIPTLDGAVSLAIPPGTQHGDVHRIKGKGLRGAMHSLMQCMVHYCWGQMMSWFWVRVSEWLIEGVISIDKTVTILFAVLG